MGTARSYGEPIFKKRIRLHSICLLQSVVLKVRNGWRFA
jgi:hypothetical protein